MGIFLFLGTSYIKRLIHPFPYPSISIIYLVNDCLLLLNELSSLGINKLHDLGVFWGKNRLKW